MRQKFFFVKRRNQPMEEHRPKKLLDQVRACPELGEGMPSASNTIPIAPSRPTSAGSSATSTSAICVTRPKWATRGRGHSPPSGSWTGKRSAFARGAATPWSRCLRQPLLYSLATGKRYRYRTYRTPSRPRCSQLSARPHIGHRGQLDTTRHFR